MGGQIGGIDDCAAEAPRGAVVVLEPDAEEPTERNREYQDPHREEEVQHQALRRELVEVGPAALLPLALREAPPGLDPADSFDETLDALVAPVRSGMILTYPDLEKTAAAAGVGVRRGERRYALKAMFEQDAVGTLQHLAAHAAHWSAVHGAQAHGGSHDPCAWWSVRAGRTSTVLTELAAQAGADVPVS